MVSASSKRNFSDPGEQALALAASRVRLPATVAPEHYLNGHLLEQRGSAAELATPALVIDLDRFEQNLAAMQAHCAAAPVDLRPHSKTHKCRLIAERQLKAGAVGICCAKLGEAEAMIVGGIGRILLTAPVVAPGAIARLLAASRHAEDLLVVVDHAANIENLNAAAAVTHQSLSVLLDLDPGLHRTGVLPGPDALALLEQIDQAAHLKLRGLQMYAGQLMHIEGFRERQERSLAVMAQLDEFRQQAAAKGIDCQILSGGGTGSFDIDPPAGVLTELQAGSYLFMDRQYNVLEQADAGNPRFFTSLFVQTQVISCNRPRLATTDAGLKAFATDDDAPEVSEGGPQGSQYFFFGDEQGGVRWRHDAKVQAGDWLRAVTPHCDPTFNLYDEVHLIRGDRLVDIWPVDARGRGA